MYKRKMRANKYIYFDVIVTCFDLRHHQTKPISSPQVNFSSRYRLNKCIICVLKVQLMYKIPKPMGHSFNANAIFVVVSQALFF